MYQGTTPTKFGRYHIAEPLRAERLHFHRGETLKAVDHESPCPVLDQEDLPEQGIFTDQLIKGARRVKALGSCTCNTAVAHLIERLMAAGRQPSIAEFGLSLTDPVQNEKFAIVLYHDTTMRTGNPAQEYPPSDCGSSEMYVGDELERQGFIKSYKSATDIHGVVSLLQGGSVAMGSPWFNAWMEPDNQGFVDGDGSASALVKAINSGVAGGHETCIVAVERLVIGPLGEIDPGKSHVRVRNSWSTGWGDNGEYRIHLSTLQLLGQYMDFKQFVV